MKNYIKNNLKYLPAVIIFAFILGTASETFAQIKVGGFKSIAVTDSGAMEAAEFAVEAQSKRDDAEITLESIEKAESQVVQGTNFRLCIKVLIAAADEDVAYTQMVKVVVYRNLKRQFSLTGWTEEDCAEEANP